MHWTKIQYFLATGTYHQHIFLSLIGELKITSFLIFLYVESFLHFCTTIISWMRCGKSLEMVWLWAIFLITSGTEISRKVYSQLSNMKACQKQSNNMLQMETEPVVCNKHTIPMIKCGRQTSVFQFKIWSGWDTNPDTGVRFFFKPLPMKNF